MQGKITTHCSSSNMLHLAVCFLMSFLSIFGKQIEPKWLYLPYAQTEIQRLKNLQVAAQQSNGFAPLHAARCTGICGAEFLRSAHRGR